MHKEIECLVSYKSGKVQMRMPAHNVSVVQAWGWCFYVSSLLLILIALAFPRDSLGQSAGSRAEAELNLASVYWNGVARNLVSSNSLDPVSASRVYAFLSIAQNDTVAETEKTGRDESDQAPGEVEAIIRAAVASSSIAVLSEFFPLSTHHLREMYDHFVKSVDLTRASEDTVKRGGALGQAVAERTLRRARDDGSDRNSEVVQPGGLGHWRSEQDRPPLRPNWGQVRPLLIESADRFVAKPPPAVDSPSFRSALAEVKTLARQLDREQWKLVRFWADSVGTPTPTGHWNEIAAELIISHQLAERSAARTLALLNIALFDTGIACWKTKYTSWLARPSQIDPEIRPNIMLPNFPSYPSGHASFSGAAAEILSYLFPEQTKNVRKLAVDAALSRVYAGIHFPFDSDEGLHMGRRIGLRVIELDQRRGELLPHLN